MEAKKDGYTLHIVTDEAPFHPRHDCDNLGKMCCWHRRYDIGDKNPYKEPDDFWEDKALQDSIFTMRYVYGYDHSGLSISCSKFNAIDPDGWDSGTLGIIFATKDDVLKEYGDLSDSTKLEVNSHLYEEVEALNNYYWTEHYAFWIEGLNGECIDSCGGFQCEDMKAMLESMKEYASDEFHPLFDKFYEQQSDRGMY